MRVVLDCEFVEWRAGTTTSRGLGDWSAVRTLQTQWPYSISGYSGWLLSFEVDAPFRYTSKKVRM